MNVWDLLADAANNWPDRCAVQTGPNAEQLSYRDVAERALELAAHLRASGMQPGDRVGCLMHNHAEHLLAYFGIAAAGAILVSLNTRLTAHEQQGILAHAGAKLLLHDQDHCQRASELAIATTTVAAAKTNPAQPNPTTSNATKPNRFAATPAAAHEPAQLYYTSGTTGDPKGVVLSHENVYTHALAAVQELNLKPTDIWAHIAPMFHLADAWAIFAITAVGGCHVFLPQFTPQAALDLLSEQRVTITNLIPTMLNLMVKQPDAKNRSYSLRVMLSGGAPIAPDVVKRILTTFSCDYVQTYGMTETSPYLTLSILPEALLRLPLEQQLHWKCKTGRAFLGVELRVVDDHGNPVANDGKAVGEIRVRGKTVTSGYWHNPTATAAAFDDEGFLLTGDLATIDAYGFVDIVDRKKDVIKTGGESVYSVEVEHTLYEHPAVLECAVFGRPDEQWGERVVAAVVLRPEHRATEAELLTFCRARMAGYKTPKQVVFLASLPRTGSGKIQKRVLRDGM